MWNHESDGSGISLHDQVIDKIVTDGTNVKFIFEYGFEVHSPDTDIVRITTESQILFEGFQFLKCELSPRTTLQAEFREELKSIKPLLELDGIEVLDLDFQPEKNQYVLTGFTVCNCKTDGEAFLMLTFSCSKAVFYWNGYTLVTRNTKDFENIVGLQQVNWVDG